jgi:hypothetical protein
LFVWGINDKPLGGKAQQLTIYRSYHGALASSQWIRSFFLATCARLLPDTRVAKDYGGPPRVVHETGCRSVSAKAVPEFSDLDFHEYFKKEAPRYGPIREENRQKGQKGTKLKL